MEKSENAVAVIDKTNPYLVVFDKPYRFEGTEYTELDMSGLENIRAIDMIDANRALCGTGDYFAVPEMQMGYALVIAARATGMPIEFFYNMPPKAAMKVKGKVVSFFYGRD